MNTISYEGVVFTRGAYGFHRAADNSLRRLGRSESGVQIKESSFCLRAFGHGLPAVHRERDVLTLLCGNEYLHCTRRAGNCRALLEQSNALCGAIVR